ncbi:DUF1615 family protein [Escherichia coli]
MRIPALLVHTALKIKSPNGKSYSERLDSVRTEKQLVAIFKSDQHGTDGADAVGSLNAVAPVGDAGRIAFANSVPKGIRGKWTVQFRQEVFSRRGGLWFRCCPLLILRQL